MADLYGDNLVNEVIAKQNLDEDAAEFALQYFSYYFHNPSSGPLTIEQIPTYVTKFQEMTGTPVDGVLDEQVVKAMKTMPRCGCRDYNIISPFAFGDPPSWGVAEITYFIERYVGGLSQSDQDSLLTQAFGAWAEVTQRLRFRRVGTPTGANLVISTGRGRTDQFDGPSGTLAWAYLPPQSNFSGQLLMKFDLDETWILNAADRGILYLNVATHEIGHLLGLEHSQVPKALMAAYYSVGIVKPQSNDDIPRIQALYGQQTTPPAPPPPPPSPPPTPPGKVKIEILVEKYADIRINGKPVVPDFGLMSDG